MDAEILRYKVDGTVVAESINTASEVVRGNRLTTVLNAASSGETIIVPPGNYKILNATRDGVRIELMEGVLLYHDEVDPPTNAVVFVNGGSHFLTGFGRIEMKSTAQLVPGYAVNHVGGELVCVAQEISSAATNKETVRSSVTTAGNGMLYLDAQIVRSSSNVSLLIDAETDCVVRVQRLISNGDSATDHALRVTGGSSSSTRDVSIQRAQASAGNAIEIEDSGTVSLACMAAYSETGHAIHGQSVNQAISVIYANSGGAKATLQLDGGAAYVQTIDHAGSTHGVELSANTHLSAELVKVGVSRNGIKVVGASAESDAPIIDVGRVDVLTQGFYAIFGDSPQHVAIVRDYVSNQPTNNISVVSPNHN